MRTRHAPGFLAGLTFLLIVSAWPLPTAAAQDPAPYKKSDDANDTSVDVARQPVADAYPPYLGPAVDILELEIQDPDTYEFIISLKTSAGFRGRAQSGGFPGQTIHHEVQFNLPGPGSPVRMVAISSRVQHGAGEPQIQLDRVEYCMESEYNYGSEWGCPNRIFSPDYEIINGVLVIHLPKERLFESRESWGYGPSRTVSAPVRLKVGDRLTGISVDSRVNLGPFLGSEVRLSDRMPETGDLDPYVVQHSGPLTDLTLSLDSASFIAGEENTALVQVMNKASRKRLLGLSAEVQPESSGWEVIFPPSAVLDSNSTTNLTMRITPASSGPSTVRVALKAQIVNEADAFTVRTYELVAQQPLDADHSTYYFHTRGDTYTQPIDTPLATSYNMNYINRILDDPKANDTETVRATREGFGQSEAFVWKTHEFDPIPNDVRFTPQAKVPFQLVIDSPQEYTGTLSVILSTKAGSFSEFKESRQLVKGPNTLDGESLISPAVTRLLRSDSGVSAAVVFAAEAVPYVSQLVPREFTAPVLLPRESWFRLPVERDVIVPPPVGLPKVLLIAAEDREAFANPGKRTVFEADLTNAENRTITLEAENATKDLALGVAPGARFTLGPKEAIRVGILATSAKETPDNTKFTFTVLVKESGHTDKLARLPLTVIITTGLLIDEEAFVPRDDAAGKLDSGAKKSPGVGFAVLVVLVGVAGIRRFRAGRSE